MILDGIKKNSVNTISYEDEFLEIYIPHDRGSMSAVIPNNRIKSILTPMSHASAKNSEADRSEIEIVNEALTNPADSKPLCILAKPKQNALIISSDHTRPVPSHITMPILLKELRSLNPNINIKILIATGLHRATTKEELIDKFGEEIVQRESILVHDALDSEAMVSKGILPSGGEFSVNKLVDWADLLIAEGFIEPHFFAGFSGGRKSILPGICAMNTVTYNHNAKFIADAKARTGILRGNPIHADMLFAAKAVGLAFILNVAIDSDKKIIAAFAGNHEAAHAKGCDFVHQYASVKAVKADVVITSNGGYPLDQNLYQTVKGMTAAEACVHEGGVIIIVSACSDGIGGDMFYKAFANADSPEEVMEGIKSVPDTETAQDQWQSQILARVLIKCGMVIVAGSMMEAKLIEDMHMKTAKTIEEAIHMADAFLGREADIVVIPDGVGVIVSE